MAKSRLKFKLATDVVGSRKKEEEIFQEPVQVGDYASMLVAKCVVDCEKCTFKVSAHFTTKQFHITNEDVQVDMLERLATLQLSAARWGVERCQYWNEQREGEDPDQLGMDFPEQ